MVARAAGSASVASIVLSVQSVWLMRAMSGLPLAVFSCVLASLPIGRYVRSIHLGLIHAGGPLRNISMALRLAFNTVVMTVCTIVMITNSYNPFLYFRF